MKAFEIMNLLFSLAAPIDLSKTCDTCKCGDPQKEVSKIAVTMFATPDTVREAARWGADLLIVHEPTYYNHYDIHSNEKLECEKRALLESTGMTVYRYHDHAHSTIPDVIGFGEFLEMGLRGKVEIAPTGAARMLLDEPITPLELLHVLEDRCGIKHPRLCGTRDKKCSVISGMFGTPANVFEELKSDECEILLTGEACEWMLGEYARDAHQLGHKKALIIMGHIGSERAGMKYTVDILQKKLPDIESKYFECGEVYTYTD